MACGILRAFVAVTAVFGVVADVVIYEERTDLNSRNAAVRGHIWMAIDNGQDGSSKYVMQEQSMSLNSGDGGLQTVSDLLDNLIFRKGVPSSSRGSNDVLHWSGNGINGPPNMLFPSHFSVQGVLPESSQSPFFSLPVTEEPQETYEGSHEQMLQNMACLRFWPALISVKSQDNSFNTWSEDIHKRGMGEMDREQVNRITSSAERKARLWNKVVFITLLFGCFVTLFVCIGQGFQLRHAMNQTWLTASRVCGDKYEEKPLLSSLDPKGVKEDGDGFTNAAISPIYSGPAFKTKYPSSPETQY